MTLIGLKADAANDARKAKAVVEGTAEAGQEVVNQTAKHADEAAEAAKKVDGAKVPGETIAIATANDIH